MANSRSSGRIIDGDAANFEEASVDTDPGTDGYATTAICPALIAQNEERAVRAFISSIGTAAEVTLQWSRSGATAYTDYDTYTAVDRFEITDRSEGVYWRWIVKDDAQGSSGSSVFGFDWS
jgi:hypothetical protein